MAAILGLNGAAASRPIQYSGLNVSSSKMDSPIPIFWGMRRLTTNAIWYNNFQKHPISKGGKGGGKGGQYDYTAATIVALCEGPIDLIQNVWSATSSTTTSSLTALNQTLFTGTASQAVWSYLTTEYPLQALAYAYTAYLACPKMDLGSDAAIPDNQYECQRLLSFAYTHTTPGYIHPDTLVQNNGIDVQMSDCIFDLLTSAQYGLGFASGDIGSMTQYTAYCRAQGLFFSPLLDAQEKGVDVIDRYAQLTNSWIYWSGTQIAFYPLADAAITGNSVTFTPQNDVSYNLTPNDVMGDVPFKINRINAADAYNRTRLDISDRTLGYSSNPLEYKDQTLVDQYGLRDNSGIDGKDVCDPIVGKIIVQLIGKRAAYIRNTYSFKTNYRFVRCLPGTVLTITDANIGLNQVRVRVRTVQENKDQTLDFLCEEFPGTVATYNAYDPNVGNVATFPNANADPGSVNTPCIVEPNSTFTGGVPRLLIALSGGANFGSAQVNISFDNVNYSPIGTITSSAAQGLLTGNLASHADPDTTNTLAVNCAESLATLPTPSHADADALRSLFCIAAQPVLTSGVYVMPTTYEIGAWGNTSPTGTYTDNLTYLRRGQYGTSPASHSTGDQFSVIDPSLTSGTTIAYDLPASYIGSTIYFKFVAINGLNETMEDISTALTYSYAPNGTGFGGGTGGVPTTPTGFTATGGVNSVALAWNANPSTDNVTGYQIWYAPGTSVAFGSCSLLTTVSATGYTVTGLPGSTAYTFYLVAVNGVGSSGHAGPANATTSATSINQFGVSWTCIDISTKPLGAFIGGFSAGIPWKLPATTSSPAGFVEAKFGGGPGSDTFIGLQKDGVSIGSIKIAAGATIGTLICASDVSFAAGDYLDMIAPASWNGMSGATRITIMGTR